MFYVLFFIFGIDNRWNIGGFLEICWLDVLLGEYFISIVCGIFVGIGSFCEIFGLGGDFCYDYDGVVVGVYCSVFGRNGVGNMDKGGRISKKRWCIGCF